MTILATDINRGISGGSQNTTAPLIASEKTFIGSLLSRDPTGFIHRLVAGEPFAGISIKRVEANDWKNVGAANGDLLASYVSGRFYMPIALAGLQLDAIKKRKVYASDDNTFTFSANGNTYIGMVVEFINTNLLIVECTSDELLDAAPGVRGFETLADAPTTLTSKQANKLLRAPVTAGRTYTLPPAADWVGQTFALVNTGGAFAVTIAANAGEFIGGAATLVQTATKGRSTVLLSTGIVGAEIEIISNQ